MTIAYFIHSYENFGKDLCTTFQIDNANVEHAVSKSFELMPFNNVTKIASQKVASRSQLINTVS